jgi:hypothetical protein
MTQPQGNMPGAVPPPKKTSPVVWILGGCAVVVMLGGIAFAVLVWWGFQKAKSYAEGTIEASSGQMTTVARLWSDVPPFEGMTPSQQAEMPLAVRALAGPFLDTLMRGLNNGKPAGHWDVAFFTVSGRTTRDVEAFYVPARMGKFGWQQQGGCANVSTATFCSFQKREGDKGTGLLIVAANDEAHKSTALYFIRQEAQEKGAAGKP